MDDCIFCKIIKNEVPSTKVFEDAYGLAFMDIMPATRGHTLIVPQKHYETFADVPEDEICEIMKTIHQVAKGVINATKAKGYKIESFNGEYAGQKVKHVHFHIIPRYEKDGIEFQEGSGWWQPQVDIYKNGEIQELAKKIRESM